MDCVFFKKEKKKIDVLDLIGDEVVVDCFLSFSVIKFILVGCR